MPSLLSKGLWAKPAPQVFVCRPSRRKPAATQRRRLHDARSALSQECRSPFQGQRGTGFAGPLLAPPFRGVAAKPTRGVLHSCWRGGSLPEIQRERELPTVDRRRHRHAPRGVAHLEEARQTPAFGLVGIDGEGVVV